MSTVLCALQRAAVSCAVVLVATLGFACPAWSQDGERDASAITKTDRNKADKDKAEKDKAEKKEVSISTSEVKKSELDPDRIRLAFYSLFFTTVPLAVLVGALIFLLHTGRPESHANFEPFFGGGQTTQLVVIIMVAGNVCSLAIAGILGGSEVSAIYGGVVGYILGKKTGP